MMGAQAAVFTPRQQNPTNSWEFNSSERRCWASGGEENRRGGSRRLHSTRRPGCEGNHQADGHADHHQDAHDPEYALATGNRCSFTTHVTHRRMRVTIGRLKSSSLGTSCRASPRRALPEGCRPPPAPFKGGRRRPTTGRRPKKVTSSHRLNTIPIISHSDKVDNHAP